LLVSPDGTAHIFDAHKIRAGDVLEAGSVKVRFESVVQPTLPWTGAIAHARAKLQLMIVSTLQKAFAALLPPGFVLALAGTVIGLVAGRRHDASLYWIGVLALASLVGVLSRLLLLALIDATSFPAVFPWYLSAASPLALAFVVLGVSAGVIGWLRRGESSTKGVSEE
jgi:hypothetical protein